MSDRGGEPVADRQHGADWVAVAIPVAVLALGAWSYRHVADDGFINLRVTSQLLTGNGPVFNAGERVEAVTSPLWIAALAIGSLLTPIRMEWLAVALGLGLTLVGLAAASAGAIHLVRLARPGATVIPAGALVYAVLPVAWEYSTSGLEGGLDRAWIGLTFAALAHRAAPGTGHWVESRWLALGVGLAPLVRPDFAVFWVAIVGLCLWTARRDVPLRRRAGWLALALLPAVLYEVFRIAYYGALLPNTAYAKEAGALLPSRGWHYLVDFAGPIWLWVPVVVLAAGAIAPLLRSLRGIPRAHWLVMALVAAGLAHLAYVVLIGGDFMRGRLLLPGLFALLAPIAVVPVERLRVAAVAAVVPWAVLTATVVRPAPAQLGDDPNFGSPRELMILLSGNRHPVTTDDYARGLTGQSIVLTGRGLYQATGTLETSLGPVPPREGDPEIVVISYAVGLSSYRLPIDVYVLDALGLGDTFTAHLSLDERGRPGHEKVLAAAWVWARFADPEAPPEHGAVAIPDLLLGGAGTDLGPITTEGLVDDVELARQALECPTLERLRDVARAPLTVGRVLANVTDAIRLHGLRIPSDPARAVEELC
jgi:arabinofuranosyltransferase